MPIPFRSLLDSAVANATFVDATVDDIKEGKLTLRKSSGDATAIDDVQNTINYNKRTVYNLESIAAAGAISKNDNVLTQVRRVQGSGTAITVGTQPFGSSASTPDGLMIILRGNSATNTVTLQNSDTQYGAILNGDMTLRVHEQIALMYDAIAERWIEQYRKDFVQ